MNKAFFLVILFSQVQAFGDSVKGLTIANTYEIYNSIQAEGGRLIRGHEPGDKVKELVDIGVTDVLIFKNQRNGEVDLEKRRLNLLGITDEHIFVNYDMPWKDIKSTKDECIKTVKAANVLLKIARKSGATGYFHCTAGQDRTGLLAGVLRMALDRWTPSNAFQNEMCARGYGHGAPRGDVSETVEKNLNPIFVLIAAGIKRGDASVSSPIFALDPAICSKSIDPKNTPQFSCR